MWQDKTPAESGSDRDPAGRYDVAIVGGGAAGLSAAITLGRALRRVVVIDAGKPRNEPASHMYAFLGHDGLPPQTLLEKGRAEIAAYGVALLQDTVDSVEAGDTPDDLSFTVKTGSGTLIETRRVLFAVGAKDTLPNIPGLADIWGTDVHVCPYCHGWEVRNGPLAVIATGEHSPTYAMLIRNWTPDLIYFEHESELLTREQSAQFDALGIHRIPGSIRRLVLDDGRLVAIEMENGERIARSAVFFPTHLVGNTSLLESLGAAIHESPQGPVVEVDSQGRTTVPGVWAAGNVTNPALQVVGAAAEGNAAGGGINMELIMEDVRRKVREIEVSEYRL